MNMVGLRMGLDKNSIVHEIKARVSISSVVKTAVELKGSGPNFIGLCPFHKEKTPSFHVRDKVGRFKCFGCGAFGDVIEFTMRMRSLAFKEAVDYLAERAGIKTVTLPSAPKASADVLAAQTVAQTYFVKALQSPEGKRALNYLLERRGLSTKMIEQAGLGFGGLNRDELFSHLKRHGVSENVALEAGLIKAGKFSLSPQFLARITFPIRTFEGVLVGFGGRALDDEQPKYVNTHTYRHYEKRRNFYGLFESKRAILKGMAPFLVEGYFDAMAFWALGMPAIALCGTAFSDDHARVLKKISKRVILCFDADEAGLLALKKSLIVLNEHGVSSSLIIIHKKDPGTYLDERALPELKALAENTQDSLCYVIDQSSIAANAVSQRVEQIDSLLPILARIKRPLVRRQYVAYLAQRLHEDPSLLWADIERRLKSSKKESKTEAVSNEVTQFSGTERLLLRIAILHPALATKLSELAPHVSPQLSSLIAVLILHENNPDSDGHVGIESVVHKHNPACVPEVVAILRENIELSFDEAEALLEALKVKIARKEVRESLRKKRLLLQGFEQKRDFSAILQTLKEQRELLHSQKRSVNVTPKPEKETQVEKQPGVMTKTQLNAKKTSYVEDDIAIFDSSEDWL